ncbi:MULTISPECIES: ABC transporter permease [Caloramator]|jgi:peptide/nickel transport system permease protein|uniref:Oligopeptide transport system permease protein OppB (TC 3.A.1.5.1) n=1 Tax=Caloramator australicus RC3 TaxID=857293 RepID=G0V4P5_9CLOT|nr:MULTISPECIES: ABC transporter permease [Caloramator]MDO6353591.1 ABC transporter permease [Caloramator sp. CAR-1]CCC58085.1 Oligopeptide transport system permease protein OppB (TC 3.A.1.5.1) [Caloramator australicus RC3]
MLKYVVKRILQAIPLLFIISLITFFIINLAPGDPIYMFINPETANPVDVEVIRKSLGLDKPIYIRYILWLKNVIQGDFGKSFQHGRPVLEMILERLPNTITLAIVSTIISFLVSIPVGVYSAIKRNSILDYMFSTFAFIGISIPSFWFGLMLILLFSLKLGWLPSGGMRANFEEFDLIDRLRHIILPALVLGMASMASQMRQMRSAMLEVIRQDYIRTARSKGLSERVVIFKHALRNALLPIITIIGFIIPWLVSGAVVTETIFSWPGIGRLYIHATFMRDYPVIMGVTIISSVMVVVGSMVADILYALVDPRIKYN